ncbi:hypothetical protein [Nocardia sp. NPDC051570]|uniref:hypothetical protein n=1 Tax=Nocardia sp. NPDC051570 TaxID=3364324 RepID=UPI0037BD72A6
MTLVSVSVPLKDHDPATIVAEQVSEHFAVAPSLTIRTGGSVGLTDCGRNLVHLPTGYVVTHASWADMRRFAIELEALPIDWAQVTPTSITAEQVALVCDAFKRATTPGDPESWPWPEWAGDESQPTLSVLASHLDHALDFEQRRATITALEERAAALDPAFSKEFHGPLWHLLVAAHVDGYGVAYLLAVLHRIAPDAADRAARDLVGAWEAGDSLGEWEYEWRRELAEGQPLTLHGFPDLPAANDVRGDAA